LSSVEAARIIEVTVQTLRKWVYEGRPVVGLRRKKRKELNVKKISGHLKFQAASVNALAKKYRRLPSPDNKGKNEGGGNSAAPFFGQPTENTHD